MKANSTNESIAIVTGASQGIGKATAIRLARDFGGIVLVARDHGALQQTAQQVEAAGSTSLILAMDLRDRIAAGEVVKNTLGTFGRLDVLINIAGAVPQISLLEMTDEQWDDGLALKFHGARRLTIAAWDPLKKSEGSVVFMSGNSAQALKAAFAAVGTLNAAIVALAKAFAEQGIQDGVQVNSVLPGAVMTNRRRNFMQKYAPAHGMSVEEGLAKFPSLAGIRRYGQAEEIAELMAYLVSPTARWMTGSALRIDGGEVKAP
jgi:3-oxoacyl-[acyl-carrier protein] reductase